MSQLDAAFLKAAQNSDARSSASGFIADLGRLISDPTVDRTVLGHQLLISADDIAGAIMKNTVADDNKPFQPINQASTVVGLEPDPFKLPSTDQAGGAVLANNQAVSAPTHASPSTATGQPVNAGASQHPAPAVPAASSPSTAPSSSPSKAPSKL